MTSEFMGTMSQKRGMSCHFMQAWYDEQEPFEHEISSMGPSELLDSDMHIVVLWIGIPLPR